MKKYLLLILITSSLHSFSQNDFEDLINKVVVSKKDSSISFVMNTLLGQGYFGYSQPDTNSRKLILFSIANKEVKNNPFNCKYGSYYSVNDAKKYFFKFSGSKNGFSEIQMIKKNKNRVKDVFYINLNYILEENK